MCVSVKSGCRELRSEQNREWFSFAGDKELSEFLSEEISREKQSQKAPAGSVQGFEIISANAAEVELEKKHDNEM